MALIWFEFLNIGSDEAFCRYEFYFCNVLLWSEFRYDNCCMGFLSCWSIFVHRERILEYRDESQRLDQCSRLYDSSVSNDAFEFDASHIVQVYSLIDQISSCSLFTELGLVALFFAILSKYVYQALPPAALHCPTI